MGPTTEDGATVRSRIYFARVERPRAIIATWADGVYHGVSLLDDDGRGNTDIAIRAKVTKRGSDVEVDLSDSAPQLESFLNSSYANMRSSVAMTGREG